MGSERKRVRCEATGLGSSHGLRLRLEKCWQTGKWSVLKCAPISIAAGFSTIRPRPGASDGATLAPAATAPAYVARGLHRSAKPDEENPTFARCAVSGVALRNSSGAGAPRTLRASAYCDGKRRAWRW